MRRRRSPPASYLSLARSDLYRSRTFGSGASLATSLRFEKAIGCLRGFLWKQEVGWPKSHSCLSPASLGKSPGAALPRERSPFSKRRFIPSRNAGHSLPDALRRLDLSCHDAARCVRASIAICARRWGYLNVPDFMTRSDLLLLTLGTRFRKQSQRCRTKWTQPFACGRKSTPLDMSYGGLS